MTLDGRMGPPWFARRRPEGAIAVMRLGLAAVSLVTIYFDPTEPVQYEGVADRILSLYLAFSAGVLAVVWWKPRWSSSSLPIHVLDLLVAATLMLFTGGPSSPFFAFFGFTLLAAGYRWGLRETLATGLAAGLLFVPQALLVGAFGLTDGWVDGAFDLNHFVIRSSSLVLLAGMVGYISEQETRARLEAAARASAGERERMGRELHDGIVQTLAGLSMKMGALGRQPHDNAPAFQQAQALLDEELINLRTLMFEAAPIDGASTDLSERLADLVGRFEHTGAAAARFDCKSADTQAPAAVCHELERVVREALINARKHSGATRVVVTLAPERQRWRLVVEDDGQGFEFEGRMDLNELDRAGLGPRVIKERVRSLGGTLTIDSRPSRGASIEMSIPRRL